MATSTPAKEDDLTVCPICFDVFCQPKCLPSCLHTFCKSCILSYINSSQTESKKGESFSFHCPVCRERFVLNDVKKWVEGLPNNHLVVNLIDRMNMMKENNDCDACLRGNKSEPASHWCHECSDKLCKTCVDCHKVIRFTMDHLTVELSEKQKFSDKKPIMQMFCEFHPTRKLEVYCFDHDIPCCLMCATVNHRKCEQVSSLEECSKTFKEEDVSNLQEKCEQLETEFSKYVDDIRTGHTESVSQAAEIRARVKETIEQTIKHLKTKEQEFEYDLSTVEKERNIRHEEKVHETESKQNLFKKVSIFLKEANKCSNEMLFLKCRELGKEVNSVQSFLVKQKDKHESYELSLELDTELQQITKNIVSCGKIKMTSSKKRCDFLTECLTLEKTIEGESCLSDVEVVNDTLILTVGKTKKKLYLYNINGTLHAKLDLTGKPWSLTKMQGYTIAVAIQSSYRIQVINIDARSPPSLSVYKNIDLSVKPYALAYFDNGFFLTSGSYVYRTDEDGTILQELNTNNKELYGMCVNASGQVLSTSWDSHRVLYVQDMISATFVFSSENLQDPFGVTHDSDGNIYVVGRFSHNVFQLKPDGTLVREIIGKDSGVRNLWGIRVALMGNSTKLILSFDNKMNIYRFGK